MGSNNARFKFLLFSIDRILFYVIKWSFLVFNFFEWLGQWLQSNRSNYRLNSICWGEFDKD